MGKLIATLGAAAVAAGITASAAIVPTQSGSDYILELSSGSDTCSTVLTGSGTLYKRGAGEVVLDTASSGFSGSVVVEAGTLTVANESALGATSSGNSTLPITVESGATLNLKLPGATKFGHNITIAGSGVGGAGAFKYTKNGGSGNSDSLINKLILSADATIDATARWGMADNKIIELNGHTLTRIGSGNWMVYNHIQSTGAPGEVNNVYGTLTFQGSPDIDENVTVVVTNIADNCVLGLWGASSVGTVKGPIKLYSGRVIQAQSGTGRTSNNIGPLHLAGPSGGSATLTIEKDNAVRTMSVDGPVTGDSGMALVISGKGSVWLNNNVSVNGNTIVQGNGNLYLCGDGSVRDMKLVLKGSTTTTHEAGKTYVQMMRVANGGTEKAHFRQTGGVIGVKPGDSPRIAEVSGQRAYLTIEGGEFHASNTVFIAEKKGSFGAFRQTGGFFESYNRASDGTSMFIGRGGNALFVQTGGTNDISHVDSKGDQSLRAVMGSTNGVAEVTISGAGTEFRASGLLLGNKSDTPTTNILNIANGAKLKVNRFRKNGQSAASSLAVVNADGGILAPTFSWNITGGASGSNPDHFVVWENGFVVDTTENAINNASGTGGTTLPFLFEKPTGKGVESITLPNLTGTNYIGIGRIVIEDATGWGASAYAEFDFATKTLTHVVVTSRGCNYSDNAKAYLESPAGTSRYECVLTLSDNGGSGMFVKRGAPDLELSSTASTIDGGYAVEGGALKLGVVPSVAIPVRVESGATLNLNSKGDLTASTFAGAGSVINGNVTVTNAVRATCADIFAGNAAAFSGDLTFAAGAVFEITDAENLSAYKDENRAVALTAGGTVSRLPQLRLTNSDGTEYAGNASGWSLRLSANGKSLAFGCDHPFVLTVR